MKTKRLILLSSLFCFLSLNSLLAQETKPSPPDSTVTQEKVISEEKTVTKEESEVTKAVKEQLKLNYKHAVGLSIGGGIALEYAYALNKNFSFGARANYLPVNFTLQKEFKGDVFDMNFNVNWFHFDLFSEHVIFNLFKKLPVKVIGGFSYAVKNEQSVTWEYTESIEVGEFKLTPDDLGQLEITPQWNNFRPYLGFGLGKRVDRKKNLSVCAELGAYYAGAPTVSIQATELLEGNTVEHSEVLENNFKPYQFLPYGFITLFYNFNIK